MGGGTQSANPLDNNQNNVVSAAKIKKTAVSKKSSSTKLSKKYATGIIKPATKKSTRVYTGIKSGPLKKTKKVLKSNAKVKVYYGVRLSRQTWYYIGKKHYVSAKDVLINKAVPIKNLMGKVINDNTREIRFARQGVLTIKSSKKNKVQLFDAKGKATKKYVKISKKYKYWAIKRINGQLMVRIGNQKQWIPIKYTSLAKKSEKKIIKNLGLGLNYANRVIEKKQFKSNKSKSKKSSVKTNKAKKSTNKAATNTNKTPTNNTVDQTTNTGAQAVDNTQTIPVDNSQNSQTADQNSTDNSSQTNPTPVVTPDNDQGSTPSQTTDTNNSDNKSDQGDVTPSTDNQTNNNQGTTDDKNNQTTPVTPSTDNKSDNQNQTTPVTPSDNTNNGNKSDNKSDKGQTPQTTPSDDNNNNPQTDVKPDNGNQQHSDNNQVQDNNQTKPATPSDNTQNKPTTDNSSDKGNTTPVQPSTEPDNNTQTKQPDTKPEVDPNKQQSDNQSDKSQTTPVKPTDDSNNKDTTPNKDTKPDDQPETPVNPSDDSDKKQDNPSTDNKPDNTQSDKGQTTPTPDVKPDDQKPTTDDQYNKGQTTPDSKPTDSKTDTDKTKPNTKFDSDKKQDNQEPTVTPTEKKLNLVINYRDSNSGDILTSQTVEGSEGKTVKVPAFELPEHYVFADGQSVPESFKFAKENATEDIYLKYVPYKQVLLTVKFEDSADKNIVGTKEFSGTETKTITLTGLDAPSGYTLAKGQKIDQEYTLPNHDTSMTILVDKVNPERHLTIKITDDKGKSLASESYVGKEGTTTDIHADLKVDHPEYYEFVGETVPATYTFGKTDETKTYTVRLKSTNQAIQFVDEDGNVVSSKSYKGQIGSTQATNLTTPEGYVLDNSSIPASVTFTPADKTTTVKVYKPVNFTYSIKDDEGNTLLTKKFTGKRGTVEKLDTAIPENNPENYEFVGDSVPATVTLGKQDEAKTYTIRLRSTNYTINLVDPDGKTVATKTYTGKIGTSQNVSGLMPEGYVLDDNQTMPVSVTMDSKDSSAIIKVYKPVTVNVTVKTTDGKTVATKSYTGKQGTTVQLSGLVDDTTKFKDADKIPATYTFKTTDDDVVYTVTPKKDTVTYTLKYVDENGNTVHTVTKTFKADETGKEQVTIDREFPAGYVDASMGIVDKSKDYVMVGTKDINKTVKVRKFQYGTFSNIKTNNYYLSGDYTSPETANIYVKDLDDDSAPVESLSYASANWSHIDGSLKKYAGHKVVIYAGPMVMGGTAAINPDASVTITLPSLTDGKAKITSAKFVYENNRWNNPNYYHLELTTDNDATITAVDNNGQQYTLDNAKKGQTVKWDVSSLVGEAESVTITAHSYGYAGDFTDSVTIKLPEFKEYQNKVNTPYGTEFMDVDYNGYNTGDKGWLELTQKSIDRLKADDHFFPEEKDDFTEYVDPMNLTPEQDKEIQDYTVRIINSARDSYMANSKGKEILKKWKTKVESGLPEDGYIYQAAGTYDLSSINQTKRVNKLAKDIAKAYYDDNVTISDNTGEYTDPDTGYLDPGNGHYVKGIVTASNKDGLMIDGNYVEQEGGGWAYTKPGKITMNDLKQIVYDDIYSMICGGGYGRIDDGSDNYGGAEYFHAQGILESGGTHSEWEEIKNDPVMGENFKNGYDFNAESRDADTDKGTEFAIAFSLDPADKNAGATTPRLLTTHYIFVKNGTRAISDYNSNVTEKKGKGTNTWGTEDDTIIGK